MSIGKLWWDVGLFYPFAGEVSRSQFDSALFAGLNEATAKAPNSMDPTELRVRAAEIIAALRDPQALILRKGEGEGPNFLPVIYEIRADGIWVIGGDAAAVKAPVGPLAGINGQPLNQFLLEHVGSKPTLQQVLAALGVLGRQAAPFEWTFEATQGVLKVKSTTKVPASIWVEGGLKGEAWAHEWSMQSPASKLDFRHMAWFDAVGHSALEGLKFASVLETEPTQIQRVVRANRGSQAFGGGSAQGLHQYPYYQTVVGEPVMGWKLPGEITHLFPAQLRRHFVVELPAVSGMTGADMLSGWSLPPSMLAPSDLSRWELAPGVIVQMPTGSYASGARIDKAMDPLIGKFGPSGTLSRRSAAALVAASVANWDHLFGFTEAKYQEGLFNYLSKAYLDGRNVEDFLPGAVPFTKDGHANGAAFSFGPAKFEDTLKNQGQLPFEAELDPAGRLVVIRTARTEIPVGSVILSLDGKPVAEVIAKAKAVTPGLPGDRSSWLWWGLSGQGNFTGKLAVELQRGKEIRKLVVARLQSNRDGFLPPKAKVPEGWRLFSSETPGTLDDLVNHLKSGRNAIVDNRYRSGPPITGELNSPVLPYKASVSEFIRTPKEPVTWGSDTTPNSIMEGSIQDHPRDPALVKGWGKAYYLVSGTTRSAAESAPIHQRLRLGDAARIVGLPTVGTTSPLCRLMFPTGDEQGRTLAWSPTPAFPIFDSGTIQFRGVPIDEQPSLKDLLSFQDEPDPLFAWVVSKAGKKASSKK